MYHLIVFFFIIGMGVALLDSPSHLDNNKPTYDAYIKQQELITANKVAELGEEVKEHQHKAERMDDGLQGDVPVRELMEGMRGFL